MLQPAQARAFQPLQLSAFVDNVFAFGDFFPERTYSIICRDSDRAPDLQLRSLTVREEASRSAEWREQQQWARRVGGAAETAQRTRSKMY